MKKIILYRSVFLLSFVLLTNISSALAQAAEKNFSITPSFREITLEEGQNEKEFSLAVSNNRDFPVVFRLSALDFGALDESGGVAFLGSSEDLKDKYSLASWIRLEKDAVVIKPGETQVVKGTIENKESLSPGGHYAAIVFKMEDDENNLAQGNDAASNVNFKPSVASLIFVRKSGGEIYNLKLEDQEIVRSFFGFFSGVRLHFQNMGNVHVTPRGFITVTDPVGREVSRGIVNEESGLILPETFRVFPVELRNTAFYFIPGYYNINIDYRYEGKNDFSSEKKRIFFIPVTFVVLCLGMGGLLVGYLWFRKNK